MRLCLISATIDEDRSWIISDLIEIKDDSTTN